MDLISVADTPELSYTRLRHPVVLAGGAYDGTKHLLTKIVCVTAYKNLPWVVAEFADGNRYAYYGDPPVLVKALRDGLVLDGLTAVTDVATHVGQMFAGITGITTAVAHNVGNSVVSVEADHGTNLQITLTKTSTSGKVATYYKPDDESDSFGLSPWAGFAIMSVNSGGSINRIQAMNAAGTTELDLIDPNTPISATASTTTTTMAEAVAAAINAYAPEERDLDFSATATDRTVWITAFDNDTTYNGWLLKVTVSGPVVMTRCTFAVNAGTISSRIRIDSIVATASGGGAAVPLLAASIESSTYGDDADLFCQALVDTINGTTGTHGFVATKLATSSITFPAGSDPSDFQEYPNAVFSIGKEVEVTYGNTVGAVAPYTPAVTYNVVVTYTAISGAAQITAYPFSDASLYQPQVGMDYPPLAISVDPPACAVYCKRGSTAHQSYIKQSQTNLTFHLALMTEAELLQKYTGAWERTGYDSYPDKPKAAPFTVDGTDWTNPQFMPPAEEYPAGSYFMLTVTEKRTSGVARVGQLTLPVHMELI